MTRPKFLVQRDTDFKKFYQRYMKDSDGLGFEAFVRDIYTEGYLDGRYSMKKGKRL